MSELERWLTKAAQATTDAERFAVIRGAWDTYVYKGAGAFDWDYDSRDVMDRLCAGSRVGQEEER